MSKRTIKPLIKYDSDEDYLDERVALEESIKIWQYICDHKLDNKYEHPNENQISKYSNGCPLCEHYSNYPCRYCPLTFRSNKEKDKKYISCSNSNFHPWALYLRLDNEMIQRGANIMLRKMKLEYYRRYRETYNPYEDE